MKFKDLNTGSIYDSMETAITLRKCPDHKCRTCPIFIMNNTDGIFCYEFASEHPEEVAKLMGYEIISEDEGAVNAMNDEPNICKILGVRVGQRFSFPYPNRLYHYAYVDENGEIWEHSDSSTNDHRIGSRALCWLINNLDSIKTYQQLTEDELDICRRLGVKWISRDFITVDTLECVDLWLEKPSFENDSNSYYGDNMGCLPASCFPSVKLGDCIYID